MSHLDEPGRASIHSVLLPAQFLIDNHPQPLHLAHPKTTHRQRFDKCDTSPLQLPRFNYPRQLGDTCGLVLGRVGRLLADVPSSNLVDPGKRASHPTVLTGAVPQSSCCSGYSRGVAVVQPARAGAPFVDVHSVPLVLDDSSAPVYEGSYHGLLRVFLVVPIRRNNRRCRCDVWRSREFLPQPCIQHF